MNVWMQKRTTKASRYAIQSIPWNADKEARTEVTCNQCLTAGLPTVIWSVCKGSVPALLRAIDLHEHRYHSLSQENAA